MWALLMNVIVINGAAMGPKKNVIYFLVNLSLHLIKLCLIIYLMVFNV